MLGASGGAGLAAVELAKLMGARSSPAPRPAEKLAVCKSRGADVLINYTKAELRDALQARDRRQRRRRRLRLRRRPVRRTRRSAR